MAKLKVRFLVTRSDIPELLHQADIFVLSSDCEGLPLVLLEAMAVGVPVIQMMDPKGGKKL